MLFIENTILPGIHPIRLCALWSYTIFHYQITPPISEHWYHNSTICIKNIFCMITKVIRWMQQTDKILACGTKSWVIYGLCDTADHIPFWWNLIPPNQRQLPIFHTDMKMHKASILINLRYEYHRGLPTNNIYIWLYQGHQYVLA